MHSLRRLPWKLSPAARLATAGLVLGCASRPVAAPATVASPRPALQSRLGAPYASPLAIDRPLTAAERRWVDRTLAGLSPRERVAQLVSVWVLGDYTNAHDPSFEEIRGWIQTERVGGILLSLGSPIEVAEKVNAMQRLAKVPLLVSCDVEPGLGRLEGGYFVPQLWSAGSATVLPSNMAIGAAGGESDAYDAGRITGRESRAIGIQLAFAPVVDVNNNPSNPVIATRSFGEDPTAVARLSAAFVRGVQDEGVAATVKHFPGHGDTDVDSHLAMPVVGASRARLDAIELVPFRAAIGAGTAGVMTAHVALPAVNGDSTPATLAPRIITGLLRETLAFRGLAITDALSMEGIGGGFTIEKSAVLAIQAGADVLLKPTDAKRAIDAVTAAVARGEITQARIDASARRVLELKARTGAAFHPMVNLSALRETVGAPAHWARARDIAERAVTLLRDSASLVPLRPAPNTLLVTYAPEGELIAGRTFADELRKAVAGTRVVRVGPATTLPELDSLAALARRSGAVVVATHVRTIEGAGRPSVAPRMAAWIEALARARPLVVVALGNPYVLRQFPSVSSYMVTYGTSATMERAAARALTGQAPVSGHAPITLPGFFARGDGLARPTAVGAAR